MSDEKKTKHTFKDLLPRSATGIVGLAVVVLVAFIFGLIFAGGNDTPAVESDNTDVASATVTSSEPELWTCSMHPQIQLKKPGKCPICFMDLIPVESSTGGDLGPRQIRMSESAAQLAQIQTTPVRRASADADIRMVGKIAYDETKLADITAWVPGRLDKLYADYTGIRVKAGDPLVYMYSPQLLAAQEELIQAKQAAQALGKSSGTLRSTAEETYTAAKEKLRLYGLTPEQIAGIESTGQTSDHLTVYAPVGGVVVHKNATEGMYVKTGTQIYSIANLSQLWVLFDAYESDLPWLEEGQKVEFTTRALPQEQFTGRITFIDPVLNEATRTVRVRAVVNNERNRLKPDMFVSGVVKSRLNNTGNVVMASQKSAQEPLLIPATAALITGTRAVVYVELPGSDDPVFEGRVVQLGPRAGDYYVVASGLEEGDMVVTNGAFKIDAELQIQAKPSMMLPDGGGAPAVHDHGQPATAVASTDTDSGSMDISTEARRALTPLYSDYFEVQVALAGDDLKTAQEAYAKLTAAIKHVDMERFTGEAHHTWMSLSSVAEKASAEGASAKTIADARDVFGKLSESIIDLHSTFGHSGEADYYLTFCPMAFDNKGAYWLQTEPVVSNSFYGAAMLRCGSIKDTLPPGTTKKD